MRYLVLLLLLNALGLSAQVTPTRTESRDYRNNGTPGPGCATATDVGKRFYSMNPAATNSTQYNCANTAAGVYTWELVGSGGGSSTTFDFTSSINATTTILNTTAGTCINNTKPFPQLANIATLSGTVASSVAYIYCDSNGVYTIGHNGAATLTCNVAACLGGITGFPDNSIPIGTATYTSTVWTAVTNYNASIRGKILAAGTGVSISCDAAGICTVSSTVTATSVGRFFPYGYYPGDTNNNVGTVANRTYWTRFVLTAPISVTGMGAGWVATGIGGGKGIRWAVVDSAGAFVATTAVQTTCASSSTCQAAFAGSPVTLPAGVYYAGTTTDSAAYQQVSPIWLRVGTPQCALTDLGTAPILSGYGTAGSGTGGSVAFGASMGTLTAYVCNGVSNTAYENFHEFFFY